MSQLQNITFGLLFIGAATYAGASYSLPENLRFQDKKHGRNLLVEVTRDKKLCAGETVKDQTCPIYLLIDDMNSGLFYVNNQANYFLKDEKYGFKVKNCTDKCRVCETEISPSEPNHKTIRLSIDDQGLPIILDSDNRLLCKQNSGVNSEINALKNAKTIVQLSADTLFKFDKSSLSDVLPQGRLKVIDAATKIKNDYVSVSKITLIGHTDRLGEKNYNLDLGQKRADTVKKLLVEHGVPASLIQTNSLGHALPITNGCFSIASRDELKKCLQPDRRVTVEITGFSK